MQGWGNISRRELRMVSLFFLVQWCAQASVLAASHSFSFSSALPRWLILFFSALSISAYVWPVPTYSKQESQPDPSLALSRACCWQGASAYRTQ